jgi:hypothetical protein
VKWTSGCIELAAQLGCRNCPQPGSCCSAHFLLGCDDPDIESCVCGKDDYCCMVGWDNVCAKNVEAFGCGVCNPPKENCCAVHESRGCSDYKVEQCVCASDMFCCLVEWDATCVKKVGLKNCGTCGG